MSRLRRAPWIVALFACASASGLASPCRGQLTSASSDSALAGAVEALAGVSLSLSEALATAYEHSPSLQRAEAELRASLATLQRERGIHDPELFATASRAVEETPSASPFAGADVVETESTSTDFGARITLPTGTRLEASLSTARLETNSSFATLNPQIDANGLVSIRQPLLEGFGTVTRGELRAAERSAQAAAARREEERLALREEVETRYWDVYAAERDFAVLELIRQQAAALLEEVRVRHEAGLVGPNQVENARAFLAQQELEALDGGERLDTSCDQLHEVMGVLGAASGRVHPADPPPPVDSTPELDRLTRRVLESNLELRAGRSEVAAARTRADAAGWGAWPSLDALGSLGGRGLSGTGQDVTFNGITFVNTADGGVGESWSEVLGRDFPSWSVGLELSFPLGSRRGRGERNRLVAEVERQKATLRASELRIERELREVHRILSHGELRLDIASRGVEASRQQLRIGLIEYRNGRNTAFELVRLGADLADAQRRYSEALVRSAKAQARLRRLSSDQVSLDAK